MRKTLILFLLLICSTVIGKEQKGRDRVDSLNRELDLCTADTGKVKLYIELANAVHLADPGEGLVYAGKALELANNKNWQLGQARAHISLGVNYNQRGELENAMEHYCAAIKLYEKLGNQKGIAQSCWGIGNIYNLQKNYKRALEYQFRALHLYEQLADQRSASYILGNIANNYLMLNAFDTALAYYDRSLAYKKATGDIHGEIIDLTNIGAVYYKKNDPAKALQNYDSALRKIDSVADRVLYARTLANTGACLVKIGTGDIDLRPDRLIPPTKEQCLDKGIGLVRHGLLLSEQVGDVEQLYNGYNDLHVAYRKKGDYKAAMESAELADRYRDSVFSGESHARIAEIESKMKLDLKEKDIQIAKLRSQVYIICIGILLMIVAIVVIKIIRQARSNKKLSDEKDRHVGHINAQNKILERIAYLQSHDLRGSVTNILGFLELYNHDNPADPGNVELMKGIIIATRKLDNSITNVVKEENKLMKDIKKETGQ